MSPPARSQSPHGDSQEADALFAGAGEMEARCRDIDWASTSLGPVKHWPSELRSAVRLCLASRGPMAVFAGRDWLAIYNESCKSLLGPSSHPAALGQPGRRLWAELRDRLAFELERLSFTPILGQDGRLLGALGVLDEPNAAPSGRRALVDSARAQAFLLELSDLLRLVGDPLEIQGAACRLLGEHLGVARAAYCECHEDAGIGIVQREFSRNAEDSVVGTYRFENFAASLALLRTGRPLVVTNTASAPPEERAQYDALDVRSYVAVPLVDNGALIAFLAVSHPSPHEWTPLEVSLVEETAGRTWAAVERVRAEEALRESEARFREMADGLPLMVWVHDAAGNQEMVNATFCEFFGVTREEMKGGRWQMLMHPDDTTAYTSEFLACLSERRRFHAEVRVKRFDGQWRWLESWARPRFTAGGEFLGFVGTSADVTERKRAEERLRESDRRKDEFLAMLGHELRNPLAAIRNAAEVMRIAAPEDERLRRAQGVLERQSAQMTRLIDGLLEVSRIARGKIHLDRETLDVRKIVDDVLQDHAPQIDARGLECATDVAPEPLWVRADPVRLSQIFDNLLANAIKFTRPPGSIRVAAEREGDAAVIRIRDTGVGIRPEMLARMFAPFQQETQDIARAAGGLGLGLALAKGLVDLHGGSISAQSAGPGTGAEFEIRLPLAATPGEDARPHRPPTATPRRILIIEDNADVGEALADLLRVLGHDATLVGTGREALEVLRSRGADIVLCDLGLPGMSGYEVASALRNDPSLRDVPIAALTGYGQPEDRRRTAEAGFDAHLTKPVALEALQSVLDRLDVGRR